MGILLGTHGAHIELVDWLAHGLHPYASSTYGDGVDHDLSLSLGRHQVLKTKQLILVIGAVVVTGAAVAAISATRPSLESSPAASSQSAALGAQIPDWAGKRAQELAVAFSHGEVDADGWPRSTTSASAVLLSGAEFDEAIGTVGAHTQAPEFVVVVLEGEFFSPRNSAPGATESTAPVAVQYVWVALDPITGDAWGSYMGHDRREIPAGAPVEVLFTR